MLQRFFRMLAMSFLLLSAGAISQAADGTGDNKGQGQSQGLGVGAALGLTQSPGSGTPSGSTLGVSASQIPASLLT